MEAKIPTIAIVTNSSMMLKPRAYRISLIFPVCTVIDIVPQSRSRVQINERFGCYLISFDLRWLWRPRTPLALESLRSSTAFNLRTDRASGASASLQKAPKTGLPSTFTRPPRRMTAVNEGFLSSELRALYRSWLRRQTSATSHQALQRPYLPG